MACYSIGWHHYRSQPAHSHSSSYLSALSRREVSKQAVRHISVSVLRAVPASRLKRTATFVHRDVMQIPVLTDSERVVVFHFVATYHQSVIASPGENKLINKKVKPNNLRASDLVTLV